MQAWNIISKHLNVSIVSQESIRQAGAKMDVLTAMFTTTRISPKLLLAVYV